MAELDNASQAADLPGSELDVASQAVDLPGFGSASACWKCAGSGKRAKRAMGARQRKRLAREGGADDGSCAVCGGSGELARRPVATTPGRVTAPRSAASTARGPRPAGSGAPRVGEELCCLTGGWRIFQRRGGHRYSTEDVVTAWVAAALLDDGDDRGAPRRHVDLGCGVGSVLQMVAWRSLERGVDHRGVGVEARCDSADLARRSVAYNGAPCRVVDGDLRDFSAPPWAAGARSLVTGTPPYFNVAFAAADGRATTDFGAFPSCEQSAGARYEFRGGVEAYCAAAARLLRAAPDGGRARFVCCEGGLHVNLARVAGAAAASGLRIVAHLPVHGRAGRPPLFGVWTMALGAGPPPPPLAPLVVRDARGARTPAYEAVLAALAMV